MSFLSSLRQQHQPQSQLALRYLLRVQGCRLVLALEVKRPDSDRAEPYKLQRAHIESPPPFFDASDTALLGQLLASSSLWENASEGSDLPKQANLFLEELKATKRAVWSDKNANYCGKHLSTLNEDSDKTNNSLTWKRDAYGQQTLSAGENKRLVFICESPFVLDGITGSLQKFDGNIDREKVEDLNQRALLAQDLDRFEEWRTYCHKNDLPLPHQLQIKTVKPLPQPVLHFSNNRHEPCVQLRLRYECDVFCTEFGWNCEPKEFEVAQTDSVKILRRDMEAEQIFERRLDELFNPLSGERKNSGWTFKGPSTWKKLFLNLRSDIEAEGFAWHVEKGFPYYFVQAEVGRAVVRSQNDETWDLNLPLITEGQARYDLLELLQNWFNTYQEGVPPDSLALADGRILCLPPNLLSELNDALGDWLYAGNAGCNLPKSQIYRLEALKELLPDVNSSALDDSAFSQAAKLQQIPSWLEAGETGVNVELRPYQLLGVCWLQHIRDLGYNGLLADDMGLGKTLQTIAHLSKELQNKRLDTPALIIAPTSLIDNWASEIQKFCTELKFVKYHGSQRKNTQSEVEEYHVVITSYALAARDIDWLAAQAWSWLILDEAHAIKNPGTQVSKAVRNIPADHRLSISGTPVENNLGELWSIMDFLMPGILGERKHFKQHYQIPIEQKGDERRLQSLLKRVAPLMLRRTKSQVAKDLPSKTTIRQNISFSEAQAAFYDEIKLQAANELEQELESSNNDGEKHIRVLTALMRLRQVCCDPALLGEPQIPSAKRTLCLDMLRELTEEGRSVLVFSQFTTMLDLIAEDLEKEGIDYLQLTGKSKNRADLVAQFQDGKAPVFLISLKAGGVGLNLTRADTVIIYDPWWNLAAQNQACDRAHRIGQKNPVFIYQLIIKDSIEEKIAQLQQSKEFYSGQVNQQAQVSAEDFSRDLQSLLKLWKEAL